MSNLDALLLGRPVHHARLLELGEAVPWRPASNRPPVESPVAWYDAADAETITTASGDVSEWQDKSGNRFHLQNPTTTQRPEYGARSINGITVPDFDGTDEWLGSPAPFCGPLTGVSPGASVFVVALSDTIASVRAIVGSTQGEGFTLYQSAASKPTVEETSIGSPEPHSTSITVSQAFATGHVIGVSTISQNMDGVVESEAHAFTPHNWPGGIFLGRYIGQSFWWDGLIAEVILYNRECDADEALDTMRYLKRKWATP